MPLFIMVLPGAMAVPLLPDLLEQDTVFPVMITEILPSGLTGLSATVLPPRGMPEDHLIWDRATAFSLARGTTSGLLDIRVWDWSSPD